MLVSLFVASLALAQEPTAQSVYDAYKAKIAGLQSATGVVEIQMPAARVRYEFKLLKPNYYLVASKSQQFISNEEKVWQYMPESKEYDEFPRQPLSGAPLLSPFRPFFTTEDKDKPELALTDYEGKPSLKVTRKPQPNMTLTAIIDRQTLLPTAWIQKMRDQETLSRFLDIQTNVPVDAATTFVLPEGAQPAKPRDFMASLLPVGAPAPPFALDTPAKKKIDLAKELKGGKALLLNFWFYG